MLAHAWHDEPHHLTDRHLTIGIAVCAVLLVVLAVVYCVMH